MYNALRCRKQGQELYYRIGISTVQFVRLGRFNQLQDNVSVVQRNATQVLLCSTVAITMNDCNDSEYPSSCVSRRLRYSTIIVIKHFRESDTIEVNRIIRNTYCTVVVYFPINSKTVVNMSSPQETGSETSLTYLRPEVAALKARLDEFIETDVLPAEEEYNEHMKSRSGKDRWTMDALPPSFSKLQQKARSLGLWNLFLPTRLVPHLPPSAKSLAPSVVLTYREYGILAESMGRSELGANVL